MTDFKTEQSSAPQGRNLPFLKRKSIALPDSKAHLIFWSILLVGLGLDLWSKKAVFEFLEQRGVFTVIDGFLQLVRALNDGAAWGMFSGKSYFLTAVSFIALLVIFAVFLFGQSRQRSVHVALGLFAAGICGNLYAIIFNYGLVRVFIDVVYWPGNHWPAFNVADSLLCIGVGLLLISTFSTGKSPRKRAQQRK